jgi:hypothetical protein
MVLPLLPVPVPPPLPLLPGLLIGLLHATP